MDGAAQDWDPLCGAPAGPRIIGWRRGLRQWFPVYDERVVTPPGVIGGACPVAYAPQRKTAAGWTCVERPDFVAADWQREMRQREHASRLVGGRFKAFGQEPAIEPAGMTSGQLATTMVLRGAVGTLIGAAAAPHGREGIWGAAGFVMGATFGELGIVGVALAALWRKAG